MFEMVAEWCGVMAGWFSCVGSPQILRVSFTLSQFKHMDFRFLVILNLSPV